MRGGSFLLQLSSPCGEASLKRVEPFRQMCSCAEDINALLANASAFAQQLIFLLSLVLVISLYEPGQSYSGVHQRSSGQGPMRKWLPERGHSEREPRSHHVESRNHPAAGHWLPTPEPVPHWGRVVHHHFVASACSVATPSYMPPSRNHGTSQPIPFSNIERPSSRKRHSYESPIRP